MRPMRHVIAAVLLLTAGPALAQQQVQDKPLYNAIYAWIKPQLDALVARPAPADPTAALAAILAAQQATNTKLDALIAAVQAGGTGTGAATTGTAAAAAANAFPANAGLAVFPSPDNTAIIRLADGTISGAPYERDKDGTIHTMGKPGAAGTGWFMNGAEVPNYSNAPVSEILVRGCYVYGKTAGGQWVLPNAGMGNNTYNAALPDVGSCVGTNSAGVTTVATPVAAIAPVAAYVVTPGSNGTVVQVQPGGVAAAINAAHDGDTLVLNGKMAEPFPVINASVLFLLTDGTDIDFTNQPLALGKGGFVNNKDIIIRGPKTGMAYIRGAGINEASAGGTGAIRPNTASHIRVDGNITLTGNQNALASGGLVGQVWEIGAGVITDGNGLGDGFTHNIYISDGCATLTIDGLTSRNAKVGHALKSRCSVTTITNSTFADAPAGTYGDDSTVIDLPNGGLLNMTNSTVAKPAGALNHGLIGLGMENNNNGPSTLNMTGGTLDAECDSPLIMGSYGAVANLKGVTEKGNKITGAGATINRQ